MQRGKMEIILVAYVLSNGTFTNITTLYKNTKAMVRSPAGYIDIFDILAGVFLGDTLEL